MRYCNWFPFHWESSNSSTSCSRSEPPIGFKFVLDCSCCWSKVGLTYGFNRDSLITGWRFFHVLGICSSYDDSPTFLTTGNGPALLNDNFFDGRPSLRLDPSTHTSSPALYSRLLPFFPSNFLFIVSLVFFRASSTSCLVSLIPSRNSSTVGTFSSVPLISLPVFGCLPKLTKKGDRSVLEWLRLLYTNSASGSHSTQSSCL